MAFREAKDGKSDIPPTLPDTHLNPPEGRELD